MIFFDSFFTADELSVPLTPTNIVDSVKTELMDGTYGDLYITRNTDFEMLQDKELTWDFDTVLYAPFDNNTLAGNLNIAVAKISHLIVKRRKEGEFEWTTIYVKEINNDVNNMNIIGSDMTAEIGTDYEYAVVPVLSGIESVYSISKDKCDCDSLVIADTDEVWVTKITDGNCDYTRTYPVQMVQTMYDRYPTAVRNTLQNYDVINVSGSWIPKDDEDECELLIGAEYDSLRTNYEKRFIDFLTNNKPKLLKNMDGKAWLCHLSGDVSNSAEDVYNNRKITFSMTEIGDHNSAEDLWDCGFHQSVTEEWW